MNAGDPLLTTVILLAACVFGLGIARFARISPIVGFFILGAIIGPQALGLIDSHSPTIHFLGELGVSFLLFDVGLHLSLKELRSGWKGLLASGALQFVIASAVLAGVAHIAGLPWHTALVLGAIFSLSSTALVLKMLSDEGAESAPVGKRATEVLVFQDVAAILLLVVLSGDLSKGVSLSSLAQPLIRMLFAATIVAFIGRFILKRLFRLLISFKSDEVITAFALLLVFLASWGTQALGLSPALGAFLGGLALSESSYSYLVRGELSPFRALLLSLFFLSVGISLDIHVMLNDAMLLFLLLVAFVSAKVCANWVAFRISGIERGVATLLSFILAQGSEFAFVLANVTFAAGIIDARTLGLSISLIGISLAITPLVAALGCFTSRSVCHVKEAEEATSEDEREVIIVSIDEYGRRIATLLTAERIPYRAHDFNIEQLAYAKSRGFNVYYADLNRPRTLGRASLGKVLAVVVLLEDDGILRYLLEGLARIDRSLPIVAATESPARLELLSSLGVETVFIKNDSSLVALFESLLRGIGFDDNRVEEAVSRALQSLEPGKLFPRLGVAEQFEPQSLAA